MKWLKRILFSVVALITLIALVIAFENWRGKRAWLKFKTEWEAKGESFDVASVIPPKVPDHENFAMSPFFAPLFDYEYAPSVTHKNSNALLRTQEVSLGNKKDLPKMGAPLNAMRTNLDEWQDHFAGDTNFPSPGETQSTAAGVLRALSKYDDVLAELRAASARSYSHYPVHYHESYSALLPHLAVLRSVLEIVRLRAVAEIELGRADDAFADLKLAIRLGESLKSEPLLISQLVRLAMHELSVSTAWETLERWNDQQLADLQRVLSQVDLLEDYPKSLRGERAFNNDVFVLMRRGEYIPGELAAGARYAPSGFLYQNQLTVNQLHQKYSFAAVDVENRRVDARRALALDTIPELKRRHPYNLFAHLLFPALSKAVLRFTKAQTTLDLAVIACALERYRRANGVYPERLQDLRPNFVDKIPHDLISGGPLQYVRRAPADFILYAVGFDEKDNAGTPPPATDALATAGVDWVWRPAPKRQTSSPNR